MKLFRRILDFFNIHPDRNQRWTLSTLFVVGLLNALLFMPSLKVAMFVWGICCGIDNIGWLVVYHKNREKFREIEKENN